MTLIPTMMQALYAKYREPRTGVHLSDIVLCPREQAFRNTDPQAITARELNYFIIGKSAHEAIQILAETYPNRYEVEKEILFNNYISMHVDLYDKIDNIVYEMKTYRGNNPEAPKKHQLNQLKSYMVATGAKEGYIVYLLMASFEEPLFKEFKITMTEQERTVIRDWMEVNAQAFKNAVERKDPSLAPHIFYDEELKWKCQKVSTNKKTGVETVTINCKYFAECKNMREQHSPQREA